MPYCPKCRDEFQDWAKVCPDCGIALVKELPTLTKENSPYGVPDEEEIFRELEKQETRKRLHKSAYPTPKPGEPLVLLTTAPGEAVAKLWMNILEEEGIPSMMKRSDMYYSESIILYSFPRIMQCRIYVLASQAKKAREILAPLSEDNPDGGE